MRWLRCVAGAATAMSVVVACGVPRGDVAPITSDELPPGLRSSTTTSTATAPTDQLAVPGGVAVYWIRDKLLVPEAITFESTPDVDRVVSLLERGPSTTDQSPEVRSAVSLSRVIRGVERDGERVTVELSDDFSEVAGADQVLALGQIVATVTSIPGVTEVEFRRDGEALDVPVPDGSLVQRAVTRSDYGSLLTEVPTKR